MQNACYNKVALGIIGITSSLLTAALVTHLGRAQSVRQKQDPPPRTKTSTRADEILVPGQQIHQIQPAGRQSIAGGTIKLTEVQTEGRKVRLQAEAFIRDSRPNMRYIWSVRVLDPKDASSTLIQKVYPEHIFDLGGQQALETTFDDIWEIPLKVEAGRYKVELTWFGLHPDSGFDRSGNPVLSNRYKGASAVVTININ